MKSITLFFLFLFSGILRAELRVECYDKSFLIVPNIKQTAADIEDELNQRLRSKNLVFLIKENVFSVPFTDFISLQKRELMDEINKIRRMQNSWDRMNFTLFNKRKSYQITPKYHIDKQLVMARLDEINRLYAVEGSDSKVTSFKGIDKIVKGETGCRINYRDTETQFDNFFNDAKFLTQPELRIKLEVVMLETDNSYEGILRSRGFTNKISSQESRFDPSDENRVNNLKLAASDIDNLVIKPGQEFSYNYVLGARTRSRGYMEAHGISGGKLVDSIGGGICQVSSTLYGPVLLAGLEVTERYNHSLRGPGIDYVPAGEDAAVVYPDKDLVFKNIYSDRSFLISAQVSEDKCTVTLYSDKPLDYRYELEKKESRHGKSLTEKVWLLKYEGNRLVSRSHVADSTYSTFE
ncbi:MAG: VanW family protein [Candidatus Wallbacteria bacterium]|nr:VanW family protein [Candidatus Wallbacteria bacterium]